MTGAPLDKRLHAYRPDLADMGLTDHVEATRFVDGTPMAVMAAVADLRREPSNQAGLDTQLLRGDCVRLFDQNNGWAWVQAERDGYVGYVSCGALADEKPLGGSAHRVSVPRTFVYAEPDLKRPALESLSMGSRIDVVGTTQTRDTNYAQLADGTFCIAAHAQPQAETAEDYVAVAEMLLHTPYLWGGASAFGIDCSGLVQLSMMMAGQSVLRDSDMQEGSIGTTIGPATGLQRGDLVFWSGHVGIMQDAEQLLHANAHTMTVTSEPLSQAVERIERLYGAPTSYRRL